MRHIASAPTRRPSRPTSTPSIATARSSARPGRGGGIPPPPLHAHDADDRGRPRSSRHRRARAHVMFRRRRSPPVLAEIPPPPKAAHRAGTLSRSELDAFAALLGRLGAAKVVVVAGDRRKSAVAIGLATAAVVAGRRALCSRETSPVRLSPPRSDWPTLPGSRSTCDPRQRRARCCSRWSWRALPRRARRSTSSASWPEGRTSRARRCSPRKDFGDAIARLRSAYELVVIDAPPDHADRSLLASSPRRPRSRSPCLARPRMREEGALDGVAGLVDPPVARFASKVVAREVRPRVSRLPRSGPRGAHGRSLAERP